MTARKPKVPTGPEILDRMQKPESVTLDRFYDRNPWKGGKPAQERYLREVVDRNRRERALFIQKEDSK